MPSPLWTAARVREVLPIVTLRHRDASLQEAYHTAFPGWTPSHAIVEAEVHPLGDGKDYADIVYTYDAHLWHAYFTWDALADALNAGQPILY